MFDQFQIAQLQEKINTLNKELLELKASISVLLGFLAEKDIITQEEFHRIVRL